MSSSPSTLVQPLEPLLPILNAFIHRHKNQHGASHWFPCVPILRRSIRNLLASSAAKPSPKQHMRLQSHAKWLHSKVLPRCFLAFSQLAADNQHAPLGLLLLALLARVNTVLESIVPPPPPPVAPLPPPAIINHGPNNASQEEHTSTTRMSAEDNDRGTVISRDMLSTNKGLARKLGDGTAVTIRSASLPATSAKQKSVSPMSVPTSASGIETLKRKKAPVTAIDRAEKEKKVKPKTDKEKKAKKKKKGGDAFSDMFGGL